MGADRPKALLLLAGEPLLVHAVRALRSASSIGPIVVAAPAQEVAAVEAVLSAYNVVVVPGGAERQDSVRRALAALPLGVDLVLVHDAARALTPPALVESVVTALRSGADAVVPVLPVTDTVKRVEGERVISTVDRTHLRSVQTPQGFRRDVLELAHAQDVAGATDDAALVERLGRTVLTV